MMSEHSALFEKNKIFPAYEVSKVAEKESWRKEINRPIYHIHKWWAQRLGTVFRAILLHLMCPDSSNTWDEFYKKHEYNDRIVLDPFMGSGTTLGETLKLGAKAIGCDINPISSFLVRQEFSRVSPELLMSAYHNLEDSIAGSIQHYYKTLDPETGEEIPALYYFWVKVAKTPLGEEIPLFSRYVFAQNAYPAKKPVAQIVCPCCWNVFQGKYNDTETICPHCKKVFNPQSGPAKDTMVVDSLGNNYKIKDLLPTNGRFKEKMYAIMAIRKNKEKIYLPVRKYDLKIYQEACLELSKSDLFVPYYPVRSGYNTDQARGYNYLYWRDFFNERQLLCLSKLLAEIQKIEDSTIREQFLCLFSSTLEYNNMFCSFKGEGTGAVRPIFSNHILKPERTPLENSIWGTDKSSGCFSTLLTSRLLRAKQYLDEPFELRIDKNTNKCTKVVASEPIKANFVSNWDELVATNHSVLILNGDSSVLPIPDESVDYVVTDPPYFDFVHYSELSDFFYAWLSPVLKDKYQYFSDTTSGRDNEVQQTDAREFSRLLSNVFRECNRVLKQQGKLVFSFHHSRVEGWVAIVQAISQANLYIDDAFPVHAELMASSPKASAKEPISLDSIIICSKTLKKSKEDAVVDRSVGFVHELTKAGKKLSKADIFVIAASQCMGLCINERMSDEDSAVLIQKIVASVQMQVK